MSGYLQLSVGRCLAKYLCAVLCFQHPPHWLLRIRFMRIRDMPCSAFLYGEEHVDIVFPNPQYAWMALRTQCFADSVRRVSLYSFSRVIPRRCSLIPRFSSLTLSICCLADNIRSSDEFKIWLLEIKFPFPSFDRAPRSI